MRILVGIGSEQDAAVIKSFLSKVPEAANILAVAVVPRHSLLNGMFTHPRHMRSWRRLIKEAENLERGHALELLNTFQSAVSDSFADVQTMVLGGSPAKQLITGARRHGIDLILLSRQQVPDIPASPLGHIASRIARYAPCSVLVLNPLSPTPHVCLLATDGSAQASTAGFRLRDLLVRDRHTLIICTVAPSFDGTFVKTGSLAYVDYGHLLKDIRKSQIAVAKTIVDRESTAFQGSRFDIKKLVYTGDTVSVITKAIQDNKVDLLVVGDKGQSAPSRFLLGSVTWKLLNQETCSVLIGR